MNEIEILGDTTRKKMSIVICIILGIFFLYEHFANPEITKEKDLNSLDVVLKDYTFHEGDNKRMYPAFYFKTVEYGNLFRVNSGAMWLFKRQAFENDSLINKELQIMISNRDRGNLNQSDEVIPLYGISEGDQIYLDSRKVLRENQGPIQLMISGAFFGLAGFLFILLKKKL